MDSEKKTVTSDGVNFFDRPEIKDKIDLVRRQFSERLADTERRRREIALMEAGLGAHPSFGDTLLLAKSEFKEVESSLKMSQLILKIYDERKRDETVTNDKTSKESAPFVTATPGN